MLAVPSLSMDQLFTTCDAQRQGMHVEAPGPGGFLGFLEFWKGDLPASSPASL